MWNSFSCNCHQDLTHGSTLHRYWSLCTGCLSQDWSHDPLIDLPALAWYCTVMSARVDHAISVCMFFVQSSSQSRLFLVWTRTPTKKPGLEPDPSKTLPQNSGIASGKSKASRDLGTGWRSISFQNPYLSLSLSAKRHEHIFKNVE